MSAKIKASENYMDDVFSSIISNLILGVKKKEEMSVWGPVEMPVKSKNDFTKIFKSKFVKEENTASDVNNSLMSPNEKVIHQDSTENYASKISQHKNFWQKEISEMTKTEEIIGTNDRDEDKKRIPITCLPFHHVRNNEIVTSETQNLETDVISDENYPKTRIKSSLEYNSSSCRLFSDVQYDSGKKSAVIEERFVESSNSKLEAVSNKSESTINIQENAKPVKSNKKLPHNVNKKAHIGTECDQFDNWCLNRSREYKSRSNLNLSDNPTPADIKVKKKLFVRKDKSEERKTSDISNIPFRRREAYLNGDNCKVNEKDLTKTNLLDKNNDCHMEISTSDFQLLPSSLNSVMLKQECHNVIVSQIEDQMLSSDFTFKSNLPISVEVSCDKNNAVGLKAQHHDNSYHKIKVAENVLNAYEATCNDKNSEKKKSIKPDEFVSEANRRNEMKKRHRRKRACSTNCIPNHSYEQPPRFLNRCNEKSSIELKKQSLLKNANFKSKLSYEDSKQKTNQKKENSTICDSSESIHTNRKSNCSSTKEKTQLCVRITNEKCDKDFEFMADSFAISKIKKTLPKLSADIPDIDQGDKEINYSADAMNILLRFVFCRSYKFIMPQETTGVEVLAAAQSWNITEFVKFFQEKFLNVLTPTNASLIFSHACLYDLKEICDKCKSIVPDNAPLNTATPRKRKKMCLISISTFIDPLEISIPLVPLAQNISLSFKKQIDNTFLLKAISGCYSITGFQVLLNEKHLPQKEENKNMLEIDYSIKSIHGDQAIEGSEKKPLRSINTIYFKKKLVLKPKEVGEIFIQTEVAPYLCSTHKEKKITIKNSAGELELMMESNRKDENSDRKLFLVGKFFYHVRSS